MKTHIQNTIILLFLSLSLFAQNDQFGRNEIDDFHIGTLIEDKIGEQLDKRVADILEDKLQQALTLNGIGGRFPSYTFVLYPILNLVSKELTATAPTLHIYNIDMSLYISDFMNTTTYATLSINIKGVGKSEQQAYINAFKGIDPKSQELASFIKGGKKKIQVYISRNCEHIIQQAQSYANEGSIVQNLRESDERLSVPADGRLRALSLLSSISFSNDECYKKAIEVKNNIYESLRNETCNQYIDKAKISLSVEDFTEAANYLLRIPPDSKCSDEVDKIIKVIKAYKDEAHEIQMAIKMHESYERLESQRIKAMETIGSAYMNALAQQNRQDAAQIIINKYELDD